MRAVSAESGCLPRHTFEAAGKRLRSGYADDGESAAGSGAERRDGVVVLWTAGKIFLHDFLLLFPEKLDFI